MASDDNILNDELDDKQMEELSRDMGGTSLDDDMNDMDMTA